ncbi:leucine-rich repeat protein [Metamycoplasma hyosynoviae]|uniref:leucine-rich repeat protein n=1 Tax=Metamycoplasma hyosynoviae TaxID=29559 RepID=UPI0023606A69|nr:leucine-rich repeat protein [Metamycoplasma hyosynoviae]MDD1359393.1 leucine-rich repeat protein [Metamycoplasma hyosynoviae]
MQNIKDKEIKLQSTKKKIFTWSVLGLSASAVLMGATISTVFSNQRKVAYLDKILQSLKIDVKDKDSKTKDDIKSIDDFVVNKLNNKLYELIVETKEDEINKQPLDKEKPYTTFRTKFALRNKITKAQSNYKVFEFRDIKPPKEKEQLNELGKISENETDRVNDKVKIEFINFNRGQHLASAVAAKNESGKYKYFNIYLKQDNNDQLQYEIVNVKVIANDKKSEAIILYQLKVKSIDDEKFISDVLEIKFNDFAKTSEQLTEYLKTIEFSYENANATYIQDAVQSKVIGKKDGNILPSNYELKFDEFKTKGEHPKKITARVRIRDNVNNTISYARSIEITGFKNYLTPEELDEYIDTIQFDVENKDTKNISDISTYSQFTKINFDENKYEVDLNTFIIEKLDDLTSLNVHFRIKEKNGKTGIYSKKRTIKIQDFKISEKLLNKWISEINLDVNNKEQKIAYDYWDKFEAIDIRTNINDKFEFTPGAKVKQTDADELTINFQIQDKKDTNVKSNLREIKIKGFKTNTINSKDFDYYLYEHNGHKVACLNKRKIEHVFMVPNIIDSYKVIKVMNLYNCENFTRHYCVWVEDGIEEVENLIYTSSSDTSKLLAIYLPITLRIAKNVIVGPTNRLLYFGIPRFVQHVERLWETNMIEYDNFPNFYYYFGAEPFRKVVFDPNKLNWENGFKFSLYYPSNFKDWDPRFSKWQDYAPEYKKWLEKNGYYHLSHKWPKNKIRTGRHNFLMMHSLEPDDNKYSLIKIFQYRNTIVNEETFELPDEIVKNIYEVKSGAFYGLKNWKIKIKFDNITNFENMFSSTNQIEEVDLSGIKGLKHFDNLAPSFNSIKKLILPKDMSEEIKFSLRGWKKLEEVKLPTNVKRIKSSMFYECEKLKKINLEELTLLEEIINNNDDGSTFPKISHFIESKEMEKLDFSKTKLKKLAAAAFPYMEKLNEIILPNTLEEVGAFFTYRTYTTNNPILENNLIGFKDKKLTIKIKGIREKPSGWHEKWIGQFWRADSPNGTDQSKVKIEWQQ